ncbi:MAG: zinc ABC transporter substrate-binding protein [Bacilli bacterium]|jgi:zinc transport system substrate-binding protein
MKKILLLFISSLLLLSGCNPPLESEKLIVYTSFYVMEDFAKKIAGPYAEVKTLMPSNGEIHDYEPTTRDLVNLTNADLFIYNGANLEHFIKQLEEVMNEENPSLVFVNSTKNVNLLKEDQLIDPHTWLSPLNAKKQIEEIKNAFVLIDEKHSSYYNEQYNKFALEFDKLHELYQIFLENGKDRYLVTSHAAFGYLTSAYDLVALPIGSLHSEEEPTQQNIAHVIEIVNTYEIPYIYAESNAPSNAVITVLEETNAQLEILYTLENLSEEQIKRNADYFSIMKDNLLAIAKGFM